MRSNKKILVCAMYILLGAALLLLLFDSLILSRRNPRLRKLNIFREQP